MKIITQIIRKFSIIIRRLYIKFFCKNIKLGAKLNYRKNFVINCNENGKIAIGDNVFFNNGCSINAHLSIEIGSDCIFGENVKIYDHNHVFNKPGMKIKDQGYFCKKVVIGKNCWIGTNAIILAGAEIGEGIVIGAGCTISGKIDSNVVVRQANNLVMETIRYRHDEDVTDE